MKHQQLCLRNSSLHQHLRDESSEMVPLASRSEMSLTQSMRNAELFILSYGALVAQLHTDLKEVNKQLHIT
ncbi:hypothetical protein ACHQM5_020089 [Ranunculus cassubicifolius]